MILVAIRDGDPQGLEGLATYLVAQLRPYFSRRVGPVDEWDLTAEVVEIVLRKLPQAPDEPEAFRRWVFTIARNQLQNLERKRGRRQGHSISVGELPARQMALSSALHRFALWGRFLRARTRLRGSHREVIDHDLAEGDDRAFARARGIKTATLRTRRHRAYLALRRALASPASS